jgi:hypothetical protein
VSSLQACAEAPQTHLHIYCDAPRQAEHQAGVDAVRAYVASIEGFASVSVIHRLENLGLARSIIDGVTTLLKSHERVIVLEDDLLLSPHFLRFMNEGLLCYAEDERVASVHGYIYPVSQTLPSTFFLRGADCWGWATWRRAWQHFNPDGRALLNQLRRQRLTRSFDLNNAYPYTRMLEGQIAGRNDSWAIRWHASCFLREMLTLYPGQSLVANIGNDDSGTHGGLTTDFDVSLAATYIPVQRIALQESAAATRAVSHYFKRTRWLPRRLLRHARTWMRRRLDG